MKTRSQTKLLRDKHAMFTSGSRAKYIGSQESDKLYFGVEGIIISKDGFDDDDPPHVIFKIPGAWCCVSMHDIESIK